MKKTVCELFAGVGGFRLGLDKLKSGWETVWFSQWEPGKSSQWAHDCYVNHFGESFDLEGKITTGIDIGEVNKTKIPDHNFLVGGFPCQDYSVAHGLANEQGIQGKKGVLWWQIRNTIIAKEAPFCLFENVDRILKSPSKQRGRDFGIILSCLDNLGYSVEWRVINAAKYGAAQRRRRTFIFAYKNNTKFATKMKDEEVSNIISNIGFFAKAFPVSSAEEIKSINIEQDTVKVSDEFNFEFENAGFMRDGLIWTAKTVEKEETPILLGSILQSNVDERYYIPEDKLPQWTYLKGGKKVPRVASSGHEYMFSEGPVAFPDPWDRPGRTMLTSESTLNRSTHVVEDLETGRLRLITPVEAERLQGFDDNWTDTGMTHRFRYFCMGNALVVPMVTRMGNELDKIFASE